MRVLVTGASGFIGRTLCRALHSRGVDVCRHSHKDGDISLASLDYDDIDHVFHLAGLTFVPDSWSRPAEYARVNLLGTYNVLEHCRASSASLTYVSSYVYGEPQSLPISETHPRAANNPYALSKVMAEDACRFYANNLGVRCTVVRPFNIYGPGQDSRFLIPTIVAAATRGEGGDQITVADERPRRDFLHVNDLVELLALTLGERVSGVYNAGSGSATSVRELVEIIVSIVGPRDFVSRGEMRPNEVLEVRADIGKASRELGWSPTMSLEDGLRDLIMGSMDRH